MARRGATGRFEAGGRRRTAAGRAGRGRGRRGGARGLLGWQSEGGYLGGSTPMPHRPQRQRRRLPRQGEAKAVPDCHGENRRSWPWRGEYWQKYSRPPPDSRRSGEGGASASGTGWPLSVGDQALCAPLPCATSHKSRRFQRDGGRRGKATGRGDRAGRCVGAPPASGGNLSASLHGDGGFDACHALAPTLPVRCMLKNSETLHTVREGNSL